MQCVEAFITNAAENERSNREDPADMVASQPFDPYQSYLDPDMFNCDVPFLQPDEITTDWHMSSFEEWVGGLQFPAEATASA